MNSFKINNYTEYYTEVGTSSIDGLGLFAKRKIWAGTEWWHGTSENILMISKSQYQTMVESKNCDTIRSFLASIHKFSYYESKYDSLILCLDNARYVNHSSIPNSGFSADPIKRSLVSVALCDIEAGEEILENYLHYDQCPWLQFSDDFLLCKNS